MNEKFELSPKGGELIKETVLPKGRLTLTELLGGEAHFIDSAGQRWFLDTTRQLWEEERPHHSDPNRPKMGSPKERTEMEFEDIEDATLYALKTHFTEMIQTYQDAMTAKKGAGESEQEYLEKIEDWQNLVAYFNRILGLLDSIRKETDESGKAKLKDILTKALTNMNNINEKLDTSLV